MSTLAQEFGKRLCFARLEKGWTQMELAARSGINRGRIAAYETGAHEPLLSSALTLARELGMSLDALAREVAQ